MQDKDSIILPMLVKISGNYFDIKSHGNCIIQASTYDIVQDQFTINMPVNKLLSSLNEEKKKTPLGTLTRKYYEQQLQYLSPHRYYPFDLKFP